MKNKPSVKDKTKQADKKPLAPTGKKLWDWVPKSSLKVVPKKDAVNEANTSSGAAAVLRESKSQITIACRMMESVQPDPAKLNRFKVTLLTEGLGNEVDAFYYTRQALESAVPIFEGKKIYANHPSLIEEKVLPERDIKDILGHFENLSVELLPDGRAILVGEVVVLPGEAYDWARAVLQHALAFSKKYPDKEFIGLSINANGVNTPMTISEFIQSGNIPKGALPKLQEAMSHGVDIIKVAFRFSDAVSCDLVTEAGAGGKVMEMLEREKKSMSENKGKEAKDGGKDDGDKDGDDKELISKMLKKHMGDDASEADMGAAMEAYEFHKKAGMKSEEAAQHAASSMKCAKHMAEKKSSKESDDGDADDKKDSKKKDEPAKESEESKESESQESSVKESIKALTQRVKSVETENVRLKGVVAGFESEKQSREMEEYLDEKCASSKLPRAVTKSFRESAKGVQTKKEIDKLLSVFMEGYKGRGAALSDGFSTTSEKGATKTSQESDDAGEGFADCLN